MNTKYELVLSDIVQYACRTLYRIRALKAIGRNVSIGDLGGYIESERNLSGIGDSWVFGNAMVYGNAMVFDNAMVSDNARVYGDGKVYGKADIFRNAEVSGNAEVFGDAVVCGNAKLSGNAQVYGDAEVSGKAWIFDNAKIHGKTDVSGNARVQGHALLLSHHDYLSIGPAKSSRRFTTAYKDSEIDIRVSCGCFTGTVKEFSDAIEKTHADNKEYLEQYRLFAQLITSNFGIKYETI